jgi:ribosome recycling factor
VRFFLLYCSGDLYLTIMYDFSELKQNLANIVSWLKEEYSRVRTGRAAPSILDHVQVDVYGSKMPINQLASITVEDARTIRIVPWDANTAKNIAQAIEKASLGLSLMEDTNGLRLIFPELTGERREELISTAKKKLEEARVRSRVARDETWNDIQKQERDGVIPEDNKYRFKEEMEKVMKGESDELEIIFEKKEKEIRS